MKKTLAVACILAMGLTTAACGSNSGSAKADGVYTAEVDDATVEASYGWRDTLTVEYKDGKMVSANFESYDADGNKKSEATAEEYPMDPAPSEWIPELSENVLKAGTSSKVDVVTGATNASNRAKELLAAIEKDGVAGETLQIEGSAE